MISVIRVERFKRFDDLSLELAPLTIFTGANGAGKTTTLHALLLARQAARLPERPCVELNGVDALELGEAQALIHRQSRADTAAIEITEGETHRWVLRAPGDERSLNAHVDERPDRYSGILAQPAPAFEYLCAERYGPRDVLGTSSVALSELGVGPRGELVAQVLAVCDRDRVPESRCLGGAGESSVKDLLHQTEAWLAMIVRPVELKAEWFPDTAVTQLRFKTPGLQGEWTRAPNMGFGVSYALPIVVAALRVRPGGLLVVENPEAHLHPAGQSRMGGFLARIAADGVQVFVETHSDHVLNGVRRAVADERTGLTADRVAVHFFRGEGEPGPVVESLQIRSTGQLSSWPAGFFDQSQRDLAELARAQRRKP